MEFKLLLNNLLVWLSTVGPKILLILILTFVGIKAAKLLAARVFTTFKKARPEDEMQKRADTLSSLIMYIIVVVISAVAAIMILGQLGIEIGPILAAAGIVGLAVGFGAQHLVQDIISGFFILIDDEIRIGDVVQISGKSGLVEKVNLRMTVLRDLSGNVHYIRNGMIDVVTNMTKEYSRYVFEIGVAYREDVDEVASVMKEVDESLRNDPNFKDDILEPLEVLGLDKFADSALVVKARITTKPIKQWRVAREFNRRLKKLFDQRNIEIPFPHVTLYMGQGKQGEAAPMHVSLEKAEQ